MITNVKVEVCIGRAIPQLYNAGNTTPKSERLPTTRSGSKDPHVLQPSAENFATLYSIHHDSFLEDLRLEDLVLSTLWCLLRSPPNTRGFELWTLLKMHHVSSASPRTYDRGIRKQSLLFAGQRQRPYLQTQPTTRVSSGKVCCWSLKRTTEVIKAGRITTSTEKSTGNLVPVLA